MPFITEEIYSVRGTGRRIADDVRVAQFHAEWDFPAEENVMEHVKEITRGIRNMRAEMNVPTTARQKYMSCVRILKSVTESAHWRIPSSR